MPPPSREVPKTLARPPAPTPLLLSKGPGNRPLGPPVSSANYVDPGPKVLSCSRVGGRSQTRMARPSRLSHWK